MGTDASGTTTRWLFLEWFFAMFTGLSVYRSLNGFGDDFGWFGEALAGFSPLVGAAAAGGMAVIWRKFRPADHWPK